MSIGNLLKKYGLSPRKGLGQNFLADPAHLAKIVAAAALSPADTVIEIGPGLGTLTVQLAEAAGRVIAIELDANMVTLLRAELAHLSNLDIIEADMLKVDPASLVDGPYLVVANLPYYITSAVLRHLLEATPKPQRLVVMVQLEVAQRIVAKPGQMSLLAVSVQFFGTPTVVHRVPAGAFYPPPKVDSAVVRIDTYTQPLLPQVDVGQFFRVVKAGFGQKRKQLKNALAAGLGQPAPTITHALTEAQIDPTRRAETLSLAEWGLLVEAICKR